MAEAERARTGDARYLDAATLFVEGAIAGRAFGTLQLGQQAEQLVRAGLVYQERSQLRAGADDLDAAITYFTRALQMIAIRPTPGGDSALATKQVRGDARFIDEHVLPGVVDRHRGAMPGA